VTKVWQCVEVSYFVPYCTKRY